MGNKDGMRLSIANEAARLILEEGISDFHTARLKAYRRLRLSPGSSGANNKDIELAVLERQRLFSGDRQQEVLLMLRKTATDIMTVLQELEPMLVGSVLNGTANEMSVIQLHVFADDAKTVAILLLDQGIDYRSVERRKTDRNPEGYKGFEFEWNHIPVDALVFPEHGLRISPPSPVDGKPMKRANINKVKKLLVVDDSVSS